MLDRAGKGICITEGSNIEEHLRTESASLVLESRIVKCDSLDVHAVAVSLWIESGHPHHEVGLAFIEACDLALDGDRVRRGADRVNFPQDVDGEHRAIRPADGR